MGLFQNVVLDKHITELEANRSAELNKLYDAYAGYFLNPQIQENIRSCKEEQFQEGFLRELFVKILGYTLNPDPDFNLTTEKKNVGNAKKADGAILISGEVVGVIELKDHKTTDLRSVEGQAFGYKHNHSNCTYVIISNFEKLRFYIDNAVDVEEFSLFSLSRADFARLFLLLSYGSIAKGLPKQIKAESVNKEEQVTKDLYRDYSAFKRALFADLCERNTQYDRLTLFKKSQKLLDRLLFIFFAEDKHLLPANSIVKIIKQWEQLKELDAYAPLYDRYKKYFGYLNTGHKGKTEEIFAYNGGLFAPDEVLDAVVVDDEILRRHTIQLSEYNFASEVDVNILGHIFENSLTEIEEITTAITTGEKPTSKRKKDGVFYTPRYITTYIVDHTLGKLCREKRVEMGIVEEEYFADKKRQMATKKRLDDNLIQYREWLLGLTICDPACGSGAFLNAALDYLMTEHRLIDEMTAKLLGHTMVFPDVETVILERNLYGVDINDESIEIAKLALWLRTAQPHRKLTSLNNNIKCGNSLISDPAVAGDKAFDWAEEFPQVFAKGGFDVVIGNPPYVHLENIKKMSLMLECAGYKTYDKRGDLYCLFVEHGFNIVKDDGYVSYIMPNKWLQAGYGKPLRELFLSYELVQLVDFGDIQIFEGATTYPNIFISKKAEPKDTFFVSVLQSNDIADFYSNIELQKNTFSVSHFGSETWVVSSQEDKLLLERVKSNYATLSDFVNKESYRGIIPGLSEAFIINSKTKQALIAENINSVEIIGSILRGRNLKRYNKPDLSELEYIILAEFGSYQYLETSYPAIYRHLIQFEDKLKKRGQCNGSKENVDKPFTGQHHWLELDNTPTKSYLEQFAKPKIMYQAFQVRPCFIYDEQGLYCNNSMWFIPTDDKGILAILNSKLGWWLISKFCTQIQNGYQLIWKYFGQIPIANTTAELAELADKMLEMNRQLAEKRAAFITLLSNNVEGVKITKALEGFDSLDFKSLLAELKKQKISIPLASQSEWQQAFDQHRTACQTLAAEIASTDRTIDQMVYTLYNLTPTEIAIIEK